MQIKQTKKYLEPWHIGTHLRVHSKSFSMKTSMIGFDVFFKKSLCPCSLIKVASALEGLREALMGNVESCKTRHTHSRCERVKGNFFIGYIMSLEYVSLHFLVYEFRFSR